MIEDDVLDVSEALGDWLRPRTIKTVTKSTIDFHPVEVVTARTQHCMVQPARPEQLIKRQLDVKLRHVMVHSENDIDMGELIEFEGLDFRVIGPAQWTGYGYAEATAVETKEPLKQVSP